MIYWNNFGEDKLEKPNDVRVETINLQENILYTLNSVHRGFCFDMAGRSTADSGNIQL